MYDFLLLAVEIVCLVIFCAMVADFISGAVFLIVLVGRLLLRLLRRLWGWADREVWLLFALERRAARERIDFAFH